MKEWLKKFVVSRLLYEILLPFFGGLGSSAAVSLGQSWWKNESHWLVRIGRVIRTNRLLHGAALVIASFAILEYFGFDFADAASRVNSFGEAIVFGGASIVLSYPSVGIVCAAAVVIVLVSRLRKRRESTEV